MTEQLSYRVVAQLSGAEVRDYPEHLLVSTFDSGSMPDSGNQAFRRLAGYIFGSNLEGKQIAMTAPVLQKPVPGGYETSFVMPGEMKLEAMPGTVDATLSKHRASGGLFAAVTFSGLANDELFERKAKALLSVLGNSGYEAAGGPVYARYNGPWTPFFMRRNEVLVPVKRVVAP